MKLQELYIEIQSTQEDCSTACLKSGGCDASCCQPDKIGGEPSVTRGEIELIDKYLMAQPNFIFHEAGESACKFLNAAGKCKIYPVRPIDCRVHFCSNEAMTSEGNPRINNLVYAYHESHAEDFSHSTLVSCHAFSEENASR